MARRKSARFPRTREGSPHKRYSVRVAFGDPAGGLVRLPSGKPWDPSARLTMLLPINNPSFFCPGIATRNLRMGTISRIRNRRFPRQLSPHGGDPFGVNAQRFGHRVVDLSSHGVFVHQGKGLQGFALQPAEPTIQKVTLGSSEGGEVGHGQGAGECSARRTGMTACGCRVRPAETDRPGVEFR